MFLPHFSFSRDYVLSISLVILGIEGEEEETYRTINVNSGIVLEWFGKLGALGGDFFYHPCVCYPCCCVRRGEG
jgi:hypothetical protein